MRKSLIALLVMTVLTSFFSCNSFKINVNLDNTTGKTVYLKQFENGTMTTIDSVVAKDNKAVFKMAKSDNNDAFNVMINGWRRPLTFFADNQDVMINGDYQKYNEITISASESQEKLNKFMNEIDNLEDDQKIHYCALDFVKQNIDNPVGAYALYRYKWAFEFNDLQKLLEVMPNDMESGYKTLVVEYFEGLQRTQDGNPYIDFTMKDVNGEDFTLSSIIGKSKVIILDFWASWCPDCRKENPGLVAVYNEFKDKGLDIVSVSFDTNEDAWKKAIVDDNLSWSHHVSDLKGWNNATAELYTIAYIPQNLILDENGTIIKKNVSSERMREVLISILN